MSVCTAARNNACAHYGHRAAVGAPFPVRRPCTRKRENVMVKFILKRIGTMIIAMFMIILITFTLMHSIPGGPFTNTKGVPEEVTQAMEAKYGLDQPMPVQFVKYLGNLRWAGLGYGTLYEGYDSEPENMAWVSQYSNANMVKTDFFEAKSTAYAKSTALVDDL